MMRRVVLGALLGSLLLAPAARATRVRPLNLEQLTEKAARIVSGRVVAVDSRIDPALDSRITQITIDVQRTLKGTEGNRLTLRMLGGHEPQGRQTGPVGLPRFVPGEEVVLFLYGESRAGLTSPVGLGQGKFVKLQDKQGRTVAVNGEGNRTLFRNLSPEKIDRIPGLRDAASNRRILSPELLIGIVGDLVHQREARAPRPSR